MHLKLPSGIEAEIGCAHKFFHVEHEKDGQKFEMALRGTLVWVRIGEQEMSARALCSPMDPFCKKTGRVVATRRLMGNLKGMVDKDRKAIFYTLCGKSIPKGDNGSHG